MSKSRVSIVIPNWNGEEKLKRNLPKVLDVKGVEEVIVVDDLSQDGSVKILKERFPIVKLIQNTKNLGFGPTVNKGVSKATGEFVFLLNSDAVPEHDCLKYVQAYFENPRVFSVGFNTGGGWAWARFKDGFFWHFQTKASEEKGAHQTLWVSGGSGVFRKDIFIDTLSGFDPLFAPFYEEDLDLGYRATKRGYINLWEPRAHVEHYKQKGVIAQNFSSSYIAKIAQRNQLMFIWKNMTSKKLTKMHIEGLIKMVLAHPKYGLVFWEAFKNYDQIQKLRNVEKKQQILEDEEILGKFSIKQV